METIRITYTRYSGMSLNLLVDKSIPEDEYVPPKSGEYALVKIESLNHRIAVEEFIEKLKNG